MGISKINQMVRKALYEVLIPTLTMRRQSEVQSTQFKLLRHMNYGETGKAMQVLKSLVADVPYSNKKLQSMDMEERYRFIISSLFYAIDLRTEVEHMMAKGRIDIVARTLHAVYRPKNKPVRIIGCGKSPSGMVAVLHFTRQNKRGDVPK